MIPPTINQFTPDPECDLDCAPNRQVERTVDVALSNSFGFGGHNVTLAVRAGRAEQRRPCAVEATPHGRSVRPAVGHAGTAAASA